MVVEEMGRWGDGEVVLMGRRVGGGMVWAVGWGGGVGWLVG